jgi:putative oxidoreductase
MLNLLGTLWPWMHLGSRVIFAIAMMMLSAGHFTSTDALAGYAAAKKTPAPKAAVVVSGLMMWTGAILIALGWHRFIGAGLVILFLIPVSFKIHDYWNVTDPGMRLIDRVQFWKNLGIVGAALFIAVYSGPEWPMSLGH